MVVFNFLLIHMAPGDPASVIAGEAGAGDEQFVAQLREQFGLDKPLYVQLWLYLKGVLTLNMGFSYRNNLPVSDADPGPAARHVAAERVPPSSFRCCSACSSACWPPCGAAR